MGLSDILGNVMSSLSQDNKLVSWSIYQEKDGHISLKVRFVPVDDSAKRDSEEIHYKKKSARQVQRDRDRTLAWQQKQRTCATSTMDNAVSPGVESSLGAAMVTRSKTRATSDPPEMLRCPSTPVAHNDPVIMDLAPSPVSDTLPLESIMT